MVLLVHGDYILKKYVSILKKIKDLIKKQFNSELVYKYKDKYLRTKVDLHNTPFLNKSKSKNECYAWTSVLLLESLVNKNDKYYPVVFSNECRYIVSKQGMEAISAIDEEFIVDDSDDEYEKFN